MKFNYSKKVSTTYLIFITLILIFPAKLTIAEDLNVKESYKLFLQSKYVDALELAEQYLERHPDEVSADAAKALQIKGRCLWGLAKYDQSIEVLEEHLRKFPTDRFAAASSVFIMKAYYRTKLSSMIGYAKRTIHDYPGSYRAKQALWWLPIAATNAFHRRDIALAYAEEYVRLYPDEKDALNMGTQYYRIADYCSALGDYTRSAEFFKKYLNAYPEGKFAPIAAGKYREVKHKAKRFPKIRWDDFKDDVLTSSTDWNQYRAKTTSEMLGFQALSLSLKLAQKKLLQPEKISREINAFILLHPHIQNDTKAKLNFELAKAYLQNDKSAEAKLALENIIGEFPTSDYAEKAKDMISDMK
jgi:outer membrane protein assembly factor BamD (BamD/ComL family)